MIAIGSGAGKGNQGTGAVTILSAGEDVSGKPGDCCRGGGGGGATVGGHAGGPAQMTSH